MPKPMTGYGRPLTEDQLVKGYRNAGRNAIEICQNCGHAVDLHDRRAEDGVCETCSIPAVNGPCSTSSKEDAVRD